MKTLSLRHVGYFGQDGLTNIVGVSLEESHEQIHKIMIIISSKHVQNLEKGYVSKSL